MKNESEKKKPIGSVVYLLHIMFDGKRYSFIGNMQTFSEGDSAEKHLNDIEYMFMPTVQNHYKLAEDCKYYVKVLNYYPGVLNINHSDQVFLNEQKAKFIVDCKEKYYLNNIVLNPEPSVMNMFMRYNRDRKAEIREWLRKSATLKDLCKLADWLKDKDIDLINGYPRFFWFDSSYVKVIEKAGIYPEDYDVLMTLMGVKDWLTNKEFIDSLNDFWYYSQHPSINVQQELKSWKIGRYYRSKKKRQYRNVADYANKYMYWLCSSHGIDNAYKLKELMSDGKTLPESFIEKYNLPF